MTPTDQRLHKCLEALDEAIHLHSLMNMGKTGKALLKTHRLLEQIIAEQKPMDEAVQ